MKSSSSKKLLTGVLIFLGIFTFVEWSYAYTTLGEIIRAKLEKRRLGEDGSTATSSRTVAPTMPTPVPETLSGKMYSGSLVSGGRKRMYMVYVPASYSKLRGGSAIMAFHGGGGNMKNMSEEYELVEKADQEGFIAIFPNGTSGFRSGILATWNAGTCCGYAVEKNVDDVSYIRSLAKKLTTEFRIRKYFAIGMSNGGLMSYRLACDAADVFSAIGSVAGTDNTTSCKPSRPIPVMHIHALNDDHVLYNGGCGPGCEGKKWSVEFNSVPYTIEKWVKQNACTNTPQIVLSNSGVTCELYTGCKDNANVKLCTTTDGGHSWPGTDGNDANPKDKGEPSQAIDANDELWSFFNSQKVILPY